MLHNHVHRPEMAVKVLLTLTINSQYLAIGYGPWHLNQAWNWSVCQVHALKEHSLSQTSKMACSSTASKKNFDDLTSNPSNYTSWSKNMESYLKTCQEWLPVIGRYPEPEFTNVNAPTCQERMDHMEWQETGDLAAGTIFLCINKSQKDHVHDCQGNPEQIWDWLKELHC